MNEMSVTLTARPHAPQVLQRRLKRVAEEITLQVMEEVDSMAYAGVPVVDDPGWDGIIAIFPSAGDLVTELQVIGLIPLRATCRVFKCRLQSVMHHQI
jgi:hypothetical protein